MRDQREEVESQLEDEEDIELLLEEANAFGLRWEIDNTAKQMMEQNPHLPKLEAYVQQLIVQGYDENTARAYAEQYRDRF